MCLVVLFNVPSVSLQMCPAEVEYGCDWLFLLNFSDAEEPVRRRRGFSTLYFVILMVKTLQLSATGASKINKISQLLVAAHCLKISDLLCV